MLVLVLVFSRDLRSNDENSFFSSLFSFSSFPQIIIVIISYSYLGEPTRVGWKYFDLISSRIDLSRLRIVSRLRTPERLGRQPTCCLPYCEHLQSYWRIDLLNYSTLHFFLLKWSFLIFPRIFLERDIWQLLRKLYVVSS